MIPQKLYLPTTSLNFKNIMSSESISPVSFYRRRRFGYKNFEKVNPNPLDNSILLYEKCPVFDIQDDGLDSYPLVVEIDTRSIEDGVILENNNSYYAEQTLYLNPFTTRFIFRNAQELNITLSSTEPSIESKLVKLYRSCFVVYPNNIEYDKWNNNIAIEDIVSPRTSEYISKDIRLNKLKGLIYAYLIAANKSIPDDVVSLKKYSKQLRNILSAILTSPEGYPTELQERQLNEIYNQINRILSSEFRKTFVQINQQVSEKYNCDFDKIVEEVIGDNVWQSIVSQRYNLPLPIQILPFDFFFTKKTEKTTAIEKFLYPIKKEIAIRESNTLCQIPTSELPKLQRYRILGKFDGQTDFVTTLLNQYAEECYSKDEFLQSRYEFSTPGIKLFKAAIGDKWDGSSAQKYLNDLRYNLNEYRPFNLNDTDNITMISFAAFCQKGDSDVEKLEEYLVDNGIGDLRVAYALWGVIFGYAEMPKTFTNDFFYADKGYVERTYKYIFKQLHGIDLDDEAFAQVEQKEPTVLEKVKSFFGFGADKDSEPQNTTMLNESTTTIADQQIPPIIANWFNSDVFTQLSAPAQMFARTAVLNCYIGSIDDMFIEEIQKIEFPKENQKSLCNKTEWKKCISSLKKMLLPKSHKKSVPRRTIDRSGELFPSHTFYNDANVLWNINSFIPDELREKVIDDISWFQKEVSKGHFSKYFPDYASRKNSEVIDAYIRHMDKKFFGKINVDIISRTLKMCYPDE